MCARVCVCVCVCVCVGDCVLRVLPESEALKRHEAITAPSRSYSIPHIHRSAIGRLFFCTLNWLRRRLHSRRGRLTDPSRMT